jgi:hypothetical protein
VVEVNGGVTGVEVRVMSDWQPARIFDVHKRNKEGAIKEDVLRSMVVRVRPAGREKIYPDCDAKRWFIVHPDDSCRLRTDGKRDERLVCEHEILTD